jgi:SAM-dependent methyltransferase
MPFFRKLKNKQTERTHCRIAAPDSHASGPTLPSTPADDPRWMTYEGVIGTLAPPQSPAFAPRRKSSLCKQADFALDAYRYWCAAIDHPPVLHRKVWEFFHIAQALFERDLLTAERTGLGFGVGHEQLPALFASRGCRIVATDQAPDRAAQAGWQKSGEFAESLATIEFPTICEPHAFRERVKFEVVDMNAIPDHFEKQFDFCWSACCLEHLGSLDHGLRFIENSIETLKVGGVAVHTTEFNLSSNDDTLESQGLSIYRRRDIETVVGRLEKAGHCVEPLDFDTGTTRLDQYVDLPPYKSPAHLRLRIAEYNCTSFGLIITRGS